MSKKNIGLLLLLAALGAVYIIYFTDFFRSQTMEISARPRVERSRHGKSGVFSASFNFDQKRLITDLKVVAVADVTTNKFPHALWHLVADTNAIPLKGLFYGETPKGMKAKIPKVRPEPLQPQTKYRLLVESGERKGQVDFEIPNIGAAR